MGERWTVPAVEELLGDGAVIAEENEDVVGEEVRIREILRERRAAGDDGGAGAHAILVGELERKMIRSALELCGGNQSETARLLGLSRVTLKQKMTKFGISAKGD